jgi:hypothetical protein
MNKLSSAARLAVVLAFGLLFTVTATLAASPILPPSPQRLTQSGRSVLHAFGGGGLARQASGSSARFDATLAGLGQVRASSALSDLHELNPAVHFRSSNRGGGPLVLVDAVTRGDPQQLLSALLQLGLERPAIYSNDVGGWLPVGKLQVAGQLDSVHSLRAAMMRTRAAVSLQGDFAQGSAALRAAHTNLDGHGITVGVLSDSFDCYSVYEQPGSAVPQNGPNGYAYNGILTTAAEDESSGALPASVDVVKDGDCLDYGAPDQLPFTDEGRALLQIVHAVAPGASLAFYTGDDSEADFASGIGKLATAGARIEADDLGYFDEPFFQDGIVAQAVDSAMASGVAFFSAAGNDGTLSYDDTAPVFPTLSSTGPNSGELLYNFDPTGATNTTALSVTVPPLFPGEFAGLVLEWDQPYVTGAPQSPGASSRMDLCVTGGASGDIVIDLDGNQVVCTGANSSGVDPVQVLIIGNPASATANSAQETINISIGLVPGSAIPGRLKLAIDGDGAPFAINASFQASSTPTLQGHPGAVGALAVGAAAFWNTPRCGVAAALESYSSRGGEPILFGSDGTLLATPELRTKPDVVDSDGVNTTFFGYTLAADGLTDPSQISECANDAAFPNFFGTSAATPHAAGAAALFLQYNAALTPGQIYQALRTSADPMGITVPNYDSGYGLVRADQALAQLPAPAAAASSGSHGGGGAFDLLTLAVLAALSVACIPRARARLRPQPPQP